MRPQIMGVLNVTPDSFSDGGEFAHQEAAIDHAVKLVAAGADLIDVGGETTKPGAARVPAQDEQRRVLPIVRELVGRGIRVSIDTMNASTALAAAEAGASLINDVSGGLADAGMARVAIETDLDFVVMHWRGHSAGMDANTDYADVVREVRDALEMRAAELIITGVNPDRLIVDPGIGFAKTADQSWQLVTHLRELGSIGTRVLVGASRKRFLSMLLPEGAPIKDRDRSTAVVSALAAEAGAWGVRVHDVRGTRAALDFWASLQSSDPA
ncbi:MAG: folP [Homoserinimonas sp.]|jgi:dihydropteroate synthase|nr:folP [Homoserinimonas sp.]